MHVYWQCMYYGNGYSDLSKNKIKKKHDIPDIHFS